VAVVRAASVEELDAMADRVLDAATLDEVLGRRICSAAQYLNRCAVENLCYFVTIARDLT